MSFDSFSSPIGGASSGGPAMGGGGDGKVDQKIIMAAQQMQLQVELSEKCRKLNGLCWNICDITPKDKMDSKQQYCLTNCAERYIDAENYIKNRLVQKAQEMRGSGSFS